MKSKQRALEVVTPPFRPCPLAVFGPAFALEHVGQRNILARSINTPLQQAQLGQRLPVLELSQRAGYHVGWVPPLGALHVEQHVVAQVEC